MASNRYVILGLANVRSTWFRQVGRWATAAAIPADFVRCVSVEELRARLDSGRSFSAVLLDAGLPGIDRDLIDVTLESGAAAIVVSDGRSRRDWVSLGATSVLPEDFHRGDLMEELDKFAQPLDYTGPATTAAADSRPNPAWSGRLVAVTGGHGAGSSTVAMAVAQGLGDDPRFANLTLLADLALHADLAMLHDARDIVPGLQELVDAHRTGSPSLSEIRSVIFDATDRGYHLLLGLRRHRDWTVLRPRALAASLDSLTGSYRLVVADIEPDFEGDDEVGSVDVEERNQLARSVIRRADLVLIVGTPTMKGMTDQLRVISDVIAFGIDADRILPIINRSTRAGRARAEVTAAFGDLVSPITSNLPSPLYLPERRKLQETIRDNVRLPTQLTEPLAAAVIAVLETKAAISEHGVTDQPVAILPGSLGHFSDRENDRPDFPDVETG